MAGRDTVTYADFVMPFFLFMVGMSMSLSMRKYKSGLFTKVCSRTVKLFLLGLLTQGWWGYCCAEVLSFVRLPVAITKPQCLAAVFAVRLLCRHLAASREGGV